MLHVQRATVVVLSRFSLMQNKYSRRMWVFFNLLSSNPCTHFSSMYEVYETCGSMDRYAALREARNRLNLDDATFFAVLHARRPVSLIRPRGSYDLSPGRPDFIAHVLAILNTIGFFSIFHAHRPFLLTFYQHQYSTRARLFFVST